MKTLICTVLIGISFVVLILGCQPVPAQTRPLRAEIQAFQLIRSCDEQVSVCCYQRQDCSATLSCVVIPNPKRLKDERTYWKFSGSNEEPVREGARVLGQSLVDGPWDQY